MKLYRKDDVLKVLAEHIRRSEDRRYEGENTECLCEALREARSDVLALKDYSPYCPVCGYKMEDKDEGNIL